MQAPVIQPARGEHRNVTTSAISSGRPNLPNGISRATKAAMPSGSACCRRSQPPPGNSTDPGATLATRIFSRARSRAMALARLISAALATL